MSAGMSDSMTQWHTELRDMRINAGLTQKQIAAAIGLDQSSISSYETGRRFLPTDLLDKWAEACGATVEVRRPDPLDLGMGRLSALHLAELRQIAEVWVTIPDETRRRLISLPADLRNELISLALCWGALPSDTRRAVVLLAQSR